jgi:hypothetical protein
VALRGQYTPLIGMIVNLAVIDDHTRSIDIEHRLCTMCNIHDAQTSMAEPDISVGEHTFGVRPAMMQDVAHLHEFASVDLSA